VKSSTNNNDTTTTVRELRNVVQQFVDQRNWSKFHNLKNLSMALAIEAAELMEHTQWLTTEQVTPPLSVDASAVREELADVVSYALAIANGLDIDLTRAINDKMIKNRIKYPIDSPRTAQALPTTGVESQEGAED
jgi:dCTP diphosphatase